MLCILQDKHELIDAVNFVLNALDEGTEGVGDVVNESIRYPVRRNADVVFQLLDTSPYILRVWGWAVVKLIRRIYAVRWCSRKEIAKTHREYTFTEDDDVHV